MSANKEQEKINENSTKAWQTMINNMSKKQLKEALTQSHNSYGNAVGEAVALKENIEAFRKEELMPLTDWLKSIGRFQDAERIQQKFEELFGTFIFSFHTKYLENPGVTDPATAKIIFALLEDDILPRHLFSIIYRREFNKFTFADQQKKSGSMVVVGRVGVPAINILSDLKEKLAATKGDKKK
jgi:hypothetical protein